MIFILKTKHEGKTLQHLFTLSMSFSGNESPWEIKAQLRSLGLCSRRGREKLADTVLEPESPPSSSPASSPLSPAG